MGRGPTGAYWLLVVAASSSVSESGEDLSVDRRLFRRYGDVLASSVQLQQALKDALGSQREQPRIAIMCDPGHDYVSATWAAWLGRGIAVPLCLSHPDRCGSGRPV